MIAATAALALAPAATNVLAIRNGDSIDVTTCTHNGNGRSVDCDSVSGNSAQENTQTLYKCRGKFTTTPC
jgi:hypothetical protein